MGVAFLMKLPDGLTLNSAGNITPVGGGTRAVAAGDTVIMYHDGNGYREVGTDSALAGVVTLTGAQTITGAKTFSANTVINANLDMVGSFGVTGGINTSLGIAATGAVSGSSIVSNNAASLSTECMRKGETVDLSSAQTIAGAKTFSDIVQVNANFNMTGSFGVTGGINTTLGIAATGAISGSTIVSNNAATLSTECMRKNETVALAGAQTITGAKTYSAQTIFNSSVGINRTPSHNLGVSGTSVIAANFANTGSALSTVSMTGTATSNDAVVRMGADGNAAVFYVSTEKMRIDGTGVGIFNTSPSVALDVTGAGLFSGLLTANAITSDTGIIAVSVFASTNMTSTLGPTDDAHLTRKDYVDTGDASDMKLKTVIDESIGSVRDGIMNLDVFTFQYSEGVSFHNGHHIVRYGTAADQWKENFPHVVHHLATDRDGEGGSKSGEFYMGLHEGSQISILTKGLQEAYTMIDELKARLDQLENS